MRHVISSENRQPFFHFSNHFFGFAFDFFHFALDRWCFDFGFGWYFTFRFDGGFCFDGGFRLFPLPCASSLFPVTDGSSGLGLRGASSALPCGSSGLPLSRPASVPHAFRRRKTGSSA